MTDAYQYWRESLAGREMVELEKGHPDSHNAIQAGFYRSRRKNKQTNEITFSPAAFWYDGEMPIAREGDRMLSGLAAIELFSYCSRFPISEKLYRAVRAGGGWPDIHPAAEADRRNSTNALDPDSAEAVKDSVDNLVREAEALIAQGAASSQDASDQATDLADRLHKLEKQADDRRKELHEPHKAEIKRLDSLWNPLRDAAGSAKARLKQFVITPFLRAKEAEANKLREQAAKTGDDSPETAAAIDKASRTVSGSSGRAALREYKSAEISDYSAALAYFADNEKVRDLIQTLANAAVRSGTVPAGCKVKIEKRAA